jgi:RNAse (barnase) inhibitor barstar
MKIRKVLSNPNDAGLYQLIGETQPDIVKNVVEQAGLRFFWLDGKPVASTDDFYDQIEIVLEFPFFGKNLDALSDCLRDLDWLTGKGFVMYYSDYATFKDTDETSFSKILDVLVYAVDFRRQHPIPPLYVIFQVTEGSLYQLRTLEIE